MAKFKLFKTKKVLLMSCACIVFTLALSVIFLSFTVGAQADLTSTVAVEGLTVNSTANSTVDWSAGAGTVSWSGSTSKTSGGCGSSDSFTPAKGELIFVNNSGRTLVLEFSYSVTLNGGSVSIDGTVVSSAGSISKPLANGSSVTIVVQSSTNTEGKTTVSLSGIKLSVQEITLSCEPSQNGSYKVNGNIISEKTDITQESTQTYTLLATPSENCVFIGWYYNDVLYSTEKSVPSAAFSDSGTLTAQFAIDPLYQMAEVTGNTSYTKDALAVFDTKFFHDVTNKLALDAGLPANNSAYTKTAQSQVKDKLDIQYVPSLPWSDSMSISYSGTANGDFLTSLAEQSHASARMLSDVVRICAKENCNISFDYTNSMSGGDSSKTTNIIYYYITTATNASVSTIKANGLQLSGTSGSSGTIALSKGMYIYILAEGYTSKSSTASVPTLNFNYSASISNFKIAYNENKEILSAGFRDNTGEVLPSGKITINNVAYAIGSNGNITDMEFANLAQVALKVSTVPSGYTHIGWQITANGSTTYQYTAEYSRTMTEDCTIIAVFVPQMTITMGSNGYADATYKITSGGATASGQYVARNADFTMLYTSLADAFADTDTVVLLATATINGNWEIPSGKTLVIPFGLTDAGSTTPVSTTTSSVSNYCKVTVNGNLTVNGTLLVSAQQYCSTGSPGGPLGHLSMADGSSMTVNGVLYSYGPITGSGTITANGSAKVHEFIEVKDPRSVAYVYNIYSGRNDHHTFPFNGMFINNIEVPVTYELGATLTGHLSLKYESISTTEIPLIGPSGAMFNFTSGSITKYYDKNLGQFVIQINEGTEAETGSFSMSLTVTLVGRTETVNINSSDYYLPLSATYKLDIAGEFTINGNYKFLPGATLNIREGGKVTIASGSNVVFYRMNDYDYRGIHSASTEQWGYGHLAYPMNPLRFPGVSYPFSFNADNVGSAKLNVDGELIVKGGLYVTEDLKTEGNGITYKDNGYNYLTGKGTIDMSAAKTNLSSISEAMAAASTNDIAWDTVAVVPMKGLICTNKEEYTSLSGTVVGVEESTGVFIWHAKGEIVTENQVDATCGTAGSYDSVLKCATCGNAIKTEVVIIPATGAHSYTIESCDREYCWNECVCGLQDTKVLRTYTLIFTDYCGNITEKVVNYGDVSILVVSTSNIFELTHSGWKINGAGNAFATDALWSNFTIDASTTVLNVSEATVATAIKPGAITMTVKYDGLPEGTAMQVIFFVPVEAEDATAPSVLLNNAQTGVAVEKVNGVLIYQVTVNLTAEQIAEKTTGASGNAAITITYTDVNLTKQLDSVLLAYAKALQEQLAGSAMSGSQANAIDAVLNYGAAVQTYFNAGNGFDFAGYTDAEILGYAQNVAVSVGTPKANANGVTLHWKSANVNFRTEYNLRYYFTLENLPEGVTPTTATLTVTYFDGTATATYENLAVEADGSRYRVTYPVPASDLAKEGTSVKLVVTLSDDTTVESTEFAYGINAYLKRSIYNYTTGDKRVSGDTDGTKTEDYVNMLVSLIKLGEAVGAIEAAE